MSDYVSDDLQERVDCTYNLFAEHGPTLHAMILLHVNDKSLADDIYQDLFVYLVRKPLPKDLETPLTYLWRVVANDVKDAMRKDMCYRNMLKNYWSHFQIGSDNHCKEKVLQFLLAKEKHHILERIILDSDLHLCETKALLEKLNHNSNIREIAERLGVKERTASHYLSTGLKKLRSLLASRSDLADNLL
ncbi:MAG: sigma-70 family RNA polymerase sigma factor [Phycisphaerae bacterium]|nr:sigma-70 family RNA polymerase sigma factor [Phycisphaerae bacterium]